MADWMVYGILALGLLLVFFFYLMLRRTVMGFKEGMDDGRGGR